MYKTNEQNIRKSVTENFGDDPRIDSPDVEVIYPTPIEELIQDPIKKGKPATVVSEPKEQPVEKKEEHQCKVSFQDSVKQNIAGFMALSIFFFSLGVFMGGKK